MRFSTDSYCSSGISRASDGDFESCWNVKFICHNLELGSRPLYILFWLRHLWISFVAIWHISASLAAIGFTFEHMRFESK